MSVSHAIKMTDEQYTIEEFNSMEIDILKTLKWKINIVTPQDFYIFIQSNQDFKVEKLDIKFDFIVC